ncbi:hypothetical protein [Williamsia deligens]|uniref:Uncharacterized protein n=1 Tax=Williamsia deligens TaxID=321325 RepID=A0ABW3G9M6_9NOCA|nr:hypothetical protein [Williamsia deligens]MCP2193639.1 hypothetical protein [Williamsia deligens]
MVHDGCWSTVICTEAERATLGETSVGGWVISCRLSIGHRGDHASDAEVVPKFDRRLWLQWNDMDAHAQSLIERNPCAVPAATPCLLFEGHPGAHWFAPSNGHAHRPAPAAAPRSIGDIVEPRSAVDVVDVAPDAPAIPQDVPSMRNRAVRFTPDVDAHRPDGVPIGRHGDRSRDSASGTESAPSGSKVPADREVVAALDDVVAALTRLADLLRGPGGRRARED